MSETTNVQETQITDIEHPVNLKLQSNRRPLIGLLSILGLVLVSGLVFAGYKLGQKNTQPVNQLKPNLSIISTPTPDPTANWKAVSNEQLGIFFKYPESELQYVNPESVPQLYQSPFTFDAYNNKEKRDHRALLERDLQLEVIAYKPFNDSIRPYLDAINATDNTVVNGSLYGFTTYTKVKTISGNNIQKALIYSEPEKEYFEYDGIVIENNRNIAIIRLMTGSHDKREELLPLAEQILRTFKFSTEVTENTSWKTYTSSLYGFSIKYPENFSAKEITSQYDDTFSVLFTDNPRDSYPRGLEKGKTDITIYVGSRKMQRNDNYYGGANYTAAITYDSAKVPSVFEKEYGKKLRDINTNDGNFSGVEYKSEKSVDTSLNIALASDGLGRTFFISGKTGQPNEIFLPKYSDILDKMFSTMNIFTPITPTPAYKMNQLEYKKDNLKLSFSYFNTFKPDEQEINNSRPTGRLVFYKKTQPSPLPGKTPDKVILDIRDNSQETYIKNDQYNSELNLEPGKNISGWPEFSKVSNITVDGVRGIKAQGSSGRNYGSVTSLDDPCNVILVRVLRNNLLYEFRSEVSVNAKPLDRQEHEDLLDNIVSTFKFLD